VFRRPAGRPARVAPAAAGVWGVWLEDVSAEGAGHDDLVARVEVLPIAP
jgi:hypothetical protein